jgi:hypothetical protein
MQQHDTTSVLYSYLLARQLDGFRATDWTARVRAALLAPDRNLAHHLAREALLDLDHLNATRP